MKSSTDRFLRLSPVIPVVTLDDASIAADMARSLVRGGLKIVEITLRTPAALRAIEVIAGRVPEITVAAGTVMSLEDLRCAAAAGASLAISPGATPTLLDECRDAEIPLLPGIATASELMAGLAAKYRCFKLFPAGAAGGIAVLKAFAAPFPQARFCPTGGITQDVAASYLDLENVPCVGGSWITPPEALAHQDWPRIEALASRAAALRTAAPR